MKSTIILTWLYKFEPKETESFKTIRSLVKHYPQIKESSVYGSFSKYGHYKTDAFLIERKELK